MMKKLVLFLLLLLLTGCQNNSVSNSASSISNSSYFEIDYYSVGNADAALVECDGHYMMIDCGSNDVEITDSSNIYKLDLYLQEKEVNHLDYIICTHPDEDHYEGFVDLLKGNGQSRTFGKIYCSTKADDNTTKKFREFSNSIETLTKKIAVPRVGTTFDLGSASIEILAVDSDEKGTTNDSSIVLMVTYGENKFLFTGDAESITETYLVNNQDIKCDVLKVAHHGSSTSTSEDFLYKADPEYAIISVGYNNRYGHPSDKVLSRIENRNIQLFTTDNGTVVCKSDGNTITIEYRK